MIRTDSDSESQDSDDGRRFRFEATRKDSGLREEKPVKSSSSHRERSSNSHRNNSYDRRSDRRNSRDRNDRDRERRRDEERLKYRKSRHVRESESFERDVRSKSYKRRKSVEREEKRERSKHRRETEDRVKSLKSRDLESRKGSEDKVDKVKDGEFKVSVGPDSNSDVLSDSFIENPTNLPTSESKESDDENTYGPALPPNLNDSKKVEFIGPKLPKNVDKVDANDEQIYGPTLPSTFKRSVSPDVDDDDEDCLFGPLPLNHPALESDAIQQKLEYRAHLIRQELARIDSTEENKREEWMTELPEVKVPNLGLTARKFRTKSGPDLSDRSEWTDTPADRAKKLAEQSYSQDPVEENHEKKARKEKKKQEKSLLEMHQDKVKKEKKKEEKRGKKEVRRPFSRDVDLQISRIDQTRNKSILMKANTLDDRFSRGKYN